VEVIGWSELRHKGFGWALADGYGVDDQNRTHGPAAGGGRAGRVGVPHAGQYGGFGGAFSARERADDVDGRLQHKANVLAVQAYITTCVIGNWWRFPSADTPVRRHQSHSRRRSAPGGVNSNPIAPRNSTPAAPQSRPLRSVQPATEVRRLTRAQNSRLWTNFCYGLKAASPGISRKVHTLR
jgi:hypothetical protein